MNKTLSFLFVFLLGFVSVAVAAGKNEGSTPHVTTFDPAIPTEELSLLLNPLNKEELLTEAEGWRIIVKTKSEEIARAEISVRRRTKEIARAEEIVAKAEEARGKLDEVAQKIEEAKASGDEEKIADAKAAAAEARDIMQEVADTVDATVEAAARAAAIRLNISGTTQENLNELAEAAAKAKQAVIEVHATVDDVEGNSREEVEVIATEAQIATENASEATEAVKVQVDVTLASAIADTEKAAALSEAETAIKEAEEVEKQEKVNLLEAVTLLRAERTLLLDNLRAVVDELHSKTDTKDESTLAKIADYRLYISGVSGIDVDVTDSTSTWVALKGWVVSPEGGMRWIINIGSFLGILILAWVLSRLLSRLMGKALGTLTLPALLREFLTNSIRWIVMIIGIIWALSALEISVAPLLAMVGAAGFIIAFAMQDSLSNFASGLMILFFRPFDIGDVVDAGGVSGKVSSMNLVSTTIRTFDNKTMVVPNSKIWSDVITNATGVTERRVDMEFGIGYDDDIDQAQEILEEIVNAHPKVLKSPAPNIKMSALADSSVNFICRPWVDPADYWDVYWDVTKAVKVRFDEAGIGIPYPQQDVHLFVEKESTVSKDKLSEPLSSKTTIAQSKEEKLTDGGLDA